MGSLHHPYRDLFKSLNEQFDYIFRACTQLLLTTLSQYLGFLGFGVLGLVGLVR